MQLKDLAWKDIVPDDVACMQKLQDKSMWRNQNGI